MPFLGQLQLVFLCVCVSVRSLWQRVLSLYGFLSHICLTAEQHQETLSLPPPLPLPLTRPLTLPLPFTLSLSLCLSSVCIKTKLFGVSVYFSLFRLFRPHGGAQLSEQQQMVTKTCCMSEGCCAAICWSSSTAASVQRLERSGARGMGGGGRSLGGGGKLLVRRPPV